ncbi:MAG TPA: hypothetical protein VKX45_11595 [Bryobacteraceae bacterium]|jgi:FtsH-binding integral membrane protein|nr:hypothetical protein [Bryobacteraceae bacterium]
MASSARVRTFARTLAVLFLISWVFPAAAGLAKDTSVLPRWWGAADVTLAFAVAIGGFGVPVLAGPVDRKAEESAYRFYRIALHGLMAAGVLVMVAGGRIVWAQCATGFLWRSWLGLYILPWWLAAVGRRGGPAARAERR